MSPVLDLFAGVGIGVACRDLWRDEYAIDNSKAVVAIRAANGMATDLGDVWDGIEDANLIPEHEVQWGSPPCQTFTMAGSGRGRRALDEVLRLVDERAFLRPDDMRAFGAEHDERTALVLTPMTYAYDHLPRAIVLEQVPPVLPVWQSFEPVLQDMGYSTVTSIVHAEQYGVPQTRRRAILVARRDAPARLPRPTHSRYYPRDPTRLDPGVKKWVSMAEALDVHATMRSNYGTGGDPAARGERDSSLPSATITSKAGRNRWRFNDQSGSPFDPDWPSKRPATVVAGRDLVQNPGATANRYNGSTKSRNDGVVVSVDQAAALQSFPPDFVWPETVRRSDHMQAIGNAVPPLLARALLEEVGA